jgi:hypothetical protein
MRWPWGADGLTPREAVERDAREDDPDWYRTQRGEWVRRTVWTVDNAPESEEEEATERYMAETTWRERERIHLQRMARQGFVWHNGRFMEREEAEERERQAEKRRIEYKNQHWKAMITRESRRDFWCREGGGRSAPRLRRSLSWRLSSSAH